MTNAILKSKGKLRIKLVFALISLALIPLLAVVFQVIFKLQDLQKNEAVVHEKLIAASVAREISEFITLQIGQLNAIENTFSFLPERFESKQDFLERLLFSNDGFFDIAITDPEGMEVARVNRVASVEQKDLMSRKESEEFVAAKEKSFLIGPVYWERNRPYFLISKGIFDRRNVFQGAILAQIDARVMQHAINQSSVTEEGGRSYIVDQSGIIVAHPDVSRVFLQENFSSIPVVSSLVGDVGGNSLVVEAYTNELGEDVLGGGAPILLSLDREGKNILKTQWFVVAELPAYIALAGIRDITLFVLAILLLALLASGATALLLANTIVKPVEALHKVASEFGKGNLDFKIPIFTSDEIGDLAEAFYGMAAKLKKSIATILKSQLTIEAEKNQLQHIIGGITDAVIVTDLKRRVIIFNRVAEMLTRYSASDVIGRPIDEVLVLNDGTRKLDVTEYCPLGPEAGDGVIFLKKELALGGKQKEQIFVNVMSGQIREAQKANVGCIITLHDVTKEKEIEKLRGSFITLVAHLFRTPLSGMKWALRELIDGNVGEITKTQKEHLEQIYTEGESLIRLVGEVLNATRIEEMELKGNVRQYSVELLAKESLKNLEGYARSKEVRVVFEKPEGALSSVFVDVFQMRAVFQSLLENAIDYTPQKGSVFVTIEMKPSFFEISVRDNGIGIPKDQLSLVFKKFFRAPNAVTEKPNGTGLGLFISKNIIEEHGGKIWFESKEKEGTTFHFTIPIKENGISA